MNINVIVALSLTLIITTVSLLEIYVFGPNEEPTIQLQHIIFITNTIIFFIVVILFIIRVCEFDCFQNVERLSQNNPNRKYGRQVDESTNTLPV